jgi:two-component system chemotaxis sensor kinase CheA
MIDDADEAFIATALPAFISEAQEQTDAIEGLLLELEATPHDKELLDSLFRCAHTVKGSAGIFGLDAVVEFTHHVETLLDQLRGDHLSLNASISTLLLECTDQIKHLVRTSTRQIEDSAEQQMQRGELIVRLQEAMGAPATAVADAGATAAVASPQGLAEWQIEARFGPDTFRNGMDPLSIVRYLSGLGQVLALNCLLDEVPTLAAIDPESCHLGFRLHLQTSATREDLDGAFAFVEDDCQWQLQRLESAQEKLTRAIDGLPETPMLGDLLLSVGAITPHGLAEVLSEQSLPGQADQAHKPLIGTLLQSKAGVAPEVVQAALGKQQKMRESAPPEEGRYIRVQADRLDAVINLLGELVIAGGGALLMARESSHTELTEINLHINRLIEEIRNGTLGLRMVPVGETFSRFRRVVRDTAASLGKEVSFEIVGGDAELDKSMVEKIADPLMHLVRNSLDHGLETAQERLALGKPPTGQLTLSAQHETGAILIRIEDDGRGINRERVLQRAWERGLIPPDVVPDDETINMMIFEPGFSTAQQVTNLSGRGVGMDVVRRNIEALRGTIRLNNSPGEGLQVDIRLPLTLAIIDGFLVGVGQSKFVLPLESVVEVIESAHHQTRIDDLGRLCIELRGSVLPVLRLKTAYSIQSSDPARVSVVVVNSVRGPFGIEVETLLGQHQTVIKPLSRLFNGLRGISGSSILGSGEVALIIDVHSLSDLATANARASRP